MWRHAIALSLYSAVWTLEQRESASLLPQCGVWGLGRWSGGRVETVAEESREGRACPPPSTYLPGDKEDRFQVGRSVGGRQSGMTPKSWVPRDKWQASCTLADLSSG